MSAVSEFSAWAFGVAAVLVARYLFGLSWVTSAFLFFPFFGLINQIMANSGRRIVRALVVILLYPVVCFFAGHVTASVAAFLQGNGMQVTPTGLSILGIIVVVGLFMSLSIVAAFLSNCVDDFSIPDRIHAILVKALSMASISLVMLFVVWFLMRLNNEFLEIPSALKLLLAIVLGGVFILAVRSLLLGAPSRSKSRRARPH